VARQAYHRGQNKDPQWARAYLWQLCRKSGGDPIVALCLVAALTPAWIRPMVAALGGRKLLQLEQPASRRRSFPTD
jgi:hypothetical protein